MPNGERTYRSMELGLVDSVQCVHQNNKTGKQCGSRPIKGTNVCYRHGGNAPQVREKARLRVLLAADLAARKIVELLDDPDSKIQLAAARDLMDRAALAGPQVHAILTATGDGTPQSPWEVMFAGLERRSRDPDDDSTPHLGYEDEDDDYAGADDVIDGELVGDDDAGAQSDDLPPSCVSCGRQFPAELPEHLTDYPERCGDCRAQGVPPLPTREELAELHRRTQEAADPSILHLGKVADRPTPPPPVPGYVTAEEGVSRAAAANRKAGALGPRPRHRARPVARPHDQPSEFGGNP